MPGVRGLLDLSAMAASDETPSGINTPIPTWIAELLDIGRKDFPLMNDAKTQALISRLITRPGPSFVLEVPISFMDMTIFTTPGAWPLQGSVQDLKEHYYTNEVQFPGKGMVLEVAR